MDRRGKWTDVARLARDAVADPARFGFDVVIHLRLLAVWDPGRVSKRGLQRSIAEQLDWIADTRALLDEADEEDDYRGVDVEERGVVEEVAERIRGHLEKKRYLLILENATAGKTWEDCQEMGVPPPNRFNRGEVIFAYNNIGSHKVDAPAYIADEYLEDVERRDPVGNTVTLIQRAVASLKKAMGPGRPNLISMVTHRAVADSMWYWWMFKPFQHVPVEELVNSWVHAEVVPLPPSFDLLGNDNNSNTATLLLLEVGKAILEELCRQQLLKVVKMSKRQHDHMSSNIIGGSAGAGCWCRQPLDARHPLRRWARSSSPDRDQEEEGGPTFSWMGTSEKEDRVSFARGDGAMVVMRARPIDSAFLINYDDDSTSRSYWALRGSSDGGYGPEDDASAWSEILKYSSHRLEEEGLLRTLTTLLVAPALADSDPHKGKDATSGDGQPLGPHDLRFVNVIPNEFFIRMPNLRLLDLSYTNISSLPDSLFFNLPELRMLLLRHCKHLKALNAPNETTASPPRPRTSLNKLCVLDLSHSSIVEISDDVLLLHMTNLEELLLCHVTSLEQVPTLKSMKSLRIFRLTHSSLKGFLPEELFESTSRLCVLDLSHNPFVKSLPASLSNASSTLEEIHLHGCAGLEHVVHDDTGLVIVLQNMTNLRVFTLSHLPISRLSLKGYSKLDTIELSNLEQLEMLDLSGTSIGELPVELLNMPRLRCLYLQGVHRLRRVPWRSAERIPQVFNLDQCTTTTTTAAASTAGGPTPKEEEKEAESHIYASDPRVLNQKYSITNYKPGKRSKERSVAFLREQLPHFYVCISPCHHRAGDQVARRKSKFQARRIPHQYQTLAAKKMVEKDQVNNNDGGDRLHRHVDVLGGGGRHLKAAKLFLTSADSLLFRDHHYRDSLTDLGPGLWDWPNLRRCWLERCHQLESIFTNSWPDFYGLESLWISKLPRLTEAWRNASYPRTYGEFRNLRYVQLEYCPRLISVFPAVIDLRRLQKLVIKSCPRLQHVFAPPCPDTRYWDETDLSGLEAMELLDLRSLESIITSSPGINVTPPASTCWKLKVRGCWKLRELPKFTNNIPSSGGASRVGVEIDGEPKWLENLLVNDTGRHRRSWTTSEVNMDPAAYS